MQAWIWLSGPSDHSHTLERNTETERPTNWMNDTHTNSKRHVYSAQVYSSNLFSILVEIWRYISLFAPRVIEVSSPQSLAWVYWQTIPKYWGEKKWQDDSVVKETGIQPENAGSSPICCLSVNILRRCPWARHGNPIRRPERWYSFNIVSSIRDFSLTLKICFVLWP